jgi:hypothetical protein
VEQIIIRISTQGWLRVMCMKDIDKLYRDYLQPLRATNEMTTAEIRTVFRYMAHGKVISKQGMFGRTVKTR